MEELKQGIRAIVNSNSRRSMTVDNLMADFKLLEGGDIPFRQFGFKTLEDLLRTMPDVLQVYGYGRNASIELVVSQNSQHIRALVEKSKSSPQGNFNRNLQNVPARRQPVTPSQAHHVGSDHRSNEKHNGFGMNNKAARSGEPKKNNQIHPNPASEKQTKKMIEFVDKNIERFVSKAPAHVNDDRVPNATKTTTTQVTEKEAGTKNVGSVQSPARFPSTAASGQNGTTEQGEEFVDNVDIFEPVSSLVEIGSVVPAVCVLPVSNLHAINVQLHQNAAKLHAMSIEMQKSYLARGGSVEAARNERSTKNIKVGKFCSCQENDDWFRGLILSRPEGGMVKVYRIDSGVVNLVPFLNMYHLAKKYRFPRQLVRVTMGDIQPIGDRWSEAALGYINQTVARKRIHMYIRAIDEKTNTLDAVLIDTTGPEDIILSRELVRRQEAVWT